MSAIRRSIAATFVLLGALLFVTAAVSAEPASLRGQIEELAAREKFEVLGLDAVEGAAVEDAAGDLGRRLQGLLRGYNYMLLYGKSGAPRALRILGPQPPPSQVPSPRHAVPTARQGLHHLVEAELTGPTGARRRVTLIVDTGATTVVLPRSLIAPLGFDEGALRDGWSETANGRVAIKSGRLQSVRVGTATAHDIAVAFIADDRLGAKRLLGMSFLGRFRVTLDNTEDQIILVAK